MFTKIYDYLSVFGLLLSHIALFAFMLLFAIGAVLAFMLWMLIWEVKDRLQKFRNYWSF